MRYFSPLLRVKVENSWAVFGQSLSVDVVGHFATIPNISRIVKFPKGEMPVNQAVQWDDLSGFEHRSLKTWEFTVHWKEIATSPINGSFMKNDNYSGQVKFPLKRKQDSSTSFHYSHSCKRMGCFLSITARQPQVLLLMGHFPFAMLNDWASWQRRVDLGNVQMGSSTTYIVAPLGLL